MAKRKIDEYSNDRNNRFSTVYFDKAEGCFYVRNGRVKLNIHGILVREIDHQDSFTDCKMAYGWAKRWTAKISTFFAWYSANEKIDWQGKTADAALDNHVGSSLAGQFIYCELENPIEARKTRLGFH